MEQLFNYICKEWAIVKNAPLACIVLFLLSCVIIFFVMSWHYDARLDTLRDQVKTYEVKLDVASPDEAFKKMQTMNDNLNTALSVAESKIDDLISKKREIDDNYVTNTWLEPICVSLDDTEYTKRQVLVYSLMGQKLGIKSFFDEDFCKRKTKEMDKKKEERERDEVLNRMLNTPPTPNKPVKEKESDRK